MSVKSSTSVLMGLQALRSNRLRTFLSTLGVIIGVGSLVAILNLGDSLEHYSREQIDRTTTLDLIEISPLLSETVDGVALSRPHPIVFALPDLESLAGQLGDRAAATLSIRGSRWITVEGDTARCPAVVVATLPSAACILPIRLAAGRFFADADAAANGEVAVLSHRTASRLAGADSACALVGRLVRLGDHPLRVLGILEKDEDDKVSRVLVPMQSRVGQALLRDGNKAPSAIVKVARVEEFAAVRRSITQWLTQRFGAYERDLEVSNPTARHEQVRKGMLIFKATMGCITGISLIVGGIGIMNVLLASVSERTREIGIRRAAGARRRDVLLQFLAEAVAISGLGGLAGLVLGYVASLGGVAIVRGMTETGVTTVMTGGSVLLAFGASFLVGLLFGLYPALRAAGLSPTDAIRHE